RAPAFWAPLGTETSSMAWLKDRAHRPGEECSPAAPGRLGWPLSWRPCTRFSGRPSPRKGWQIETVGEVKLSEADVRPCHYHRGTDEFSQNEYAGRLKLPRSARRRVVAVLLLPAKSLIAPSKAETPAQFS